jgi:hypothetical protein
MLMSMRSQTEAARALAYVGAGISDVAHSHADAEATQGQSGRCTNTWCRSSRAGRPRCRENVARDGVQVHGGMGFIEETGAAQHYRDAKILTIYEGTTAIQANDLVGRKTVRDGGAVAKGIIAQVRATEAQLAASRAPTSRPSPRNYRPAARPGSGGRLRGGQHEERHQGRVRGQRART